MFTKGHISMPGFDLGWLFCSALQDRNFRNPLHSLIGRMRLQRTKRRSQCPVLRRRYILIPEKNHFMLYQQAPDFLKNFRRHLSSEINAMQFRTEGTGNRIYRKHVYSADKAGPVVQFQRSRPSSMSLKIG